MKTFYNVTLLCFALGILRLLFRAPWTSTPEGSPYTHVVLGYAAGWVGSGLRTCRERAWTGARSR